MYISEMSVEMMIRISRLLLVSAAAFAALTVILFFAFRIPKCIRMLSGGYPIYEKKRQNTKKDKRHSTHTEKLSALDPFERDEKTCLLDSEEETCLLDNLEKTELLDSEEETCLLDNGKKTELLDRGKETCLLGTKELEMIQDIAYMQDTKL